MIISLRKVGVAVGAAALLSAATASGASAANPIVVSLSGTTITVTDPTGVTQAETISTNGSGFDIQELNSSNVLQAGPGITAVVNYNSRHWVVQPTNPSIKVTQLSVGGGNGADLVSTAGVTNVPVALFGEAGNDYLITGPTADVIIGGLGNDQIYGGAGNDYLAGGEGSDNIHGENGDDTIYDKDGYADTIDGGNDYDVFTRDAGLDTATNIELYQ
jgi:Ca2+-binding RTX toxin-like protein